MTNLDQLVSSTEADRTALQELPIIRRALAGEVTRELYVEYLTQAYHHVLHTVPLLMAVGARLAPHQHWLEKEIVRYLQDEIGHEDWILNDVAASGGDIEHVRASAPAVETETMVAYAYDTVARKSPLAFFGMVFVLEGTSVTFALSAAASLQRALALPDRALTYLRSHGELDRDHIDHLASIINRFDAEQDLPQVISCARAMYWLYGNLFRGLERREVAAHAPELRRVACN